MNVSLQLSALKRIYDRMTGTEGSGEAAAKDIRLKGTQGKMSSIIDAISAHLGLTTYEQREDAAEIARSQRAARSCQAISHHAGTPAGDAGRACAGSKLAQYEAMLGPGKDPAAAGQFYFDNRDAILDELAGREAAA